MNIAKPIGWTITAIALAVLVGACGGGDTPTEPATPQSIDAPEAVVPAPTTEPAPAGADQIPPEIAERMAREARVEIQAQRDQLGRILDQVQPLLDTHFNALEEQASAISEEALEAYAPVREKLLEEMEAFRAVAAKVKDPEVEGNNALRDELQLALRSLRAALADAQKALESETAAEADVDGPAGADTPDAPAGEAADETAGTGTE